MQKHTKAKRGDEPALEHNLVDPEGEITFHDPHTDDSNICFFQDVRHGKAGFADAATTSGNGTPVLSLKKTIITMLSNDYTAARAILTMLNHTNIPKLTCQPNYRTDVPLDHLVATIEHYVAMGLDLNPDFQRGHVWAADQKVKWIEFLLKGGKSYSDIILNHPGWMKHYKGPFVVVDGKQRLAATLEFLNDGFAVFAGLHGKAEGWKASEFDQATCFRQVSFGFAVNNLQKREDVLRWYLELNEGAIAHTYEELVRVKKLLAAETHKHAPEGPSI